MDSSNLILQWMKIGGAVLFYWCNSIGMIFLNKFLFSSKALNLNAPLFVTWFQAIITTLFCWTAGLLIGDSIPAIGSFPIIIPNLELVSTCLLLSLLTAASITFKNLTLTLIEIAFYNVSLALGTIFTVLFSWLILKQRISLLVILTCVVIVVGFVLGVEEETQLTNVPILGLFFAFMSSILGPLSQIQLKRTLPLVNDNLWLLTFYNNFNGLFIYPVLIMLFGEYKHVLEFEQLGNPQFWLLMTLSGFLGVSLSFSISLQMSFTTPITANISGVTKNCIQTLLAVSVFGQDKTVSWWLGNTAVLGGSGAYTFFRMREMKGQNKDIVQIPKPVDVEDQVAQMLVSHK